MQDHLRGREMSNGYVHMLVEERVDLIKLPVDC